MLASPIAPTKTPTRTPKRTPEWVPEFDPDKKYSPGICPQQRREHISPDTPI